jgi:MFS family permease
MVALAFITTIGWSTAISLPGILIVPITAEFGWSRADVSGAIELMFVLFACVAPFSGALILRYGVARVAAASAALVVTGLLVMTLVFAKWHLSVSIGLFLGIAAGMVSLSLTATIASRWFVARRGLVVGILTASFAVGQLTFLPAAAWLSTTYGWRTAVLPVLICAAISIVLFLLLGRDWPADVDLPPHGERCIAPQPPASASGAISLILSTLKKASTVPFFWILAGTFFVCGLSSTGIVNQHFVPFCADCGIGAVVATSYLALMGVFNFIGTIGSGWLTERFDNCTLLAFYYGVRGLLLIWLPFSNFDVLALTM